MSEILEPTVICVEGHGAKALPEINRDIVSSTSEGWLLYTIFPDQPNRQQGRERGPAVTRYRISHPARPQRGQYSA